MTRTSRISHDSHVAPRQPRRPLTGPPLPAPPAVRLPAPRRKGLDSIAEGFATMEARFRPSKAKDLHVRMQFELTGEGGGSWFVVIRNGRCTVTAGRGEDPDAVLTAKASDYLKISNGEMNKVLALLQGKLRVRGDMGVVRPFFACFAKH